MILYLTEHSTHEAARREGRLVFRGYAETVEKGTGYPKKLRDRLLVEAPDHAEVERVLRGPNISAIQSPHWVLDGFRIVELHPETPANILREWHYDAAMSLRHCAVHDRRIRFQGRASSECRYSIGEQVACRRGTSIELGRVIALPLTPEEVSAGKSRGFYLSIMDPVPSGEHVYADQSEDTYAVEYLDEDDFDNYAEWELSVPEGAAP